MHVVISHSLTLSHVKVISRQYLSIDSCVYSSEVRGRHDGEEGKRKCDAVETHASVRKSLEGEVQRWVVLNSFLLRRKP